MNFRSARRIKSKLQIFIFFFFQLGVSTYSSSGYKKNFARIPIFQMLFCEILCFTFKFL